VAKDKRVSYLFCVYITAVSDGGELCVCVCVCVCGAVVRLGSESV